MNSDHVIVYVTYTKTEDYFFDKEYYNNHHIPLIMGLWKPYGLVSADAFYPNGIASETVAICECIFKNTEAFEKAIALSEVEKLGSDVVNFTNLLPHQYIIKP